MLLGFGLRPIRKNCASPHVNHFEVPRDARTMSVRFWVRWKKSFSSVVYGGTLPPKKLRRSHEEEVPCQIISRYISLTAPNRGGKTIPSIPPKRILFATYQTFMVSKRSLDPYKHHLFFSSLPLLPDQPNRIILLDILLHTSQLDWSLVSQRARSWRTAGPATAELKRRGVTIGAEKDTKPKGRAPTEVKKRGSTKPSRRPSEKDGGGTGTRRHHTSHIASHWPFYLAFYFTSRPPCKSLDIHYWPYIHTFSFASNNYIW